MKVTINPSKATGHITAPPSKSMAHRYLICAALSGGHCKISNIEFSQDILATIDCINALGGKCTKGENFVEVEGITSDIMLTNAVLPCRESGSTLRFFIPISLLSEGVKEFHGSETLIGRPQSVYEKICDIQGIEFVRSTSSITVNGLIKPGTFDIEGNISSQFISGLLFTLPLLEGDSRINLIPPVESTSYIDMTLEALEEFGVCVTKEGDYSYIIKGSQHYVPHDYAVEGDYSNAAFLDAFNFIDGNVTVEGLREKSLQGDSVYGEYFEKIKAGDAVLDITNCPDLGPILMAMAAALGGATLTGTRRLKYKESNRGEVMCEELAKFGVTTSMTDDTITVDRCELKAPDEILSGHNDHRIVMSMSTLLSITGGTVDEAQAVNKSYPGYFDAIRSLGIEVEEDGMD